MSVRLGRAGEKKEKKKEKERKCDGIREVTARGTANAADFWNDDRVAVPDHHGPERPTHHVTVLFPRIAKSTGERSRSCVLSGTALDARIEPMHALASKIRASLQLRMLGIMRNFSIGRSVFILTLVRVRVC